MKGDKLVIQEGHVKAAHNITEFLLPQIVKARGKFIIAIAGESGSGKSEIAAAIVELLSEKGIRSIILQQDDYFVYPPRTNDKIRREGIRHVGLSEIRLDVLDQNLHDIIVGKDEIEKPLVIFDEDRITKEVVKLRGIKVIIVEGTYTTLLKSVHRRIFIDRTYIDTIEVRKLRLREEQDELLERILRIEHGIISSHKPRADIIVTDNYRVKKVIKNEGKSR